MRLVDMTGRVCGQLTVIGRVAHGKHTHWLCRCVCGKETVVAGHKLRSGHTRSCGCYRRPAVDRFAERVALTDSGCMLWLGGLNGVGYGQFYGTGGERIYAHRWSYEHHVGPIPEGLVLDHLCRVRNCVNPDHLEPVTHAENILRGEGPSARHAQKSHCPAGHLYAGRNLYVHPTKGYRTCRECGRIRAAARYQRIARARKAE